MREKMPYQVARLVEGLAAALLFALVGSSGFAADCIRYFENFILEAINFLEGFVYHRHPILVNSKKVLA
jgi:hypothetical protein